MSTAIVSIPTHVAAPQQAAVKHLKVSLHDDTRRFAVADDGASFAQLRDNVRQVYGLPAGAALLFKYTDEEGDAVSLSSDAELAEAFRVAGDAALRLAVSLTDAPAVASAPAPVVATAVRAPRSAKAAAKPAPAVAKEQEAPAAPAPNAKGKARADPSAKKVEALKERNEALQGRLEAFKDRMAEMKAARAAGHVHVQALRRDLAFERAAANPKCKAMLARGRFVRDVSVPDGTALSAGALFTKAWRFRNDSAAAWPAGSRLLFAGKNAERMGAPDEVRVERAVAPGDEIDIAVPLTAPHAPGRYVAHFRLCDADGRKFGQRVWCSILVRDAAASSSASSSSSSEGEAESAAVAADADAVKYERQLQALAEMHHTDVRLNARLLNKFDGDLEAVVARLLARKTKFAARAAADPKGADGKAARKLAKAEARAARTEARLAAKTEKKAGKAA